MDTQIRETLDRVVGNVVYIQEVMKNLMDNEEIYDFLVVDDEDVIVVYYSFDDSENFFVSNVAKD